MEPPSSLLVHEDISRRRKPKAVPPIAKIATARLDDIDEDLETDRNGSDEEIAEEVTPVASGWSFGKPLNADSIGSTRTFRSGIMELESPMTPATGKRRVKKELLTARKMNQEEDGSRSPGGSSSDSPSPVPRPPTGSSRSHRKVHRRHSPASPTVEGVEDESPRRYSEVTSQMDRIQAEAEASIMEFIKKTEDGASTAPAGENAEREERERQRALEESERRRMAYEQAQREKEEEAARLAAQAEAEAKQKEELKRAREALELEHKLEQQRIEAETLAQEEERFLQEERTAQLKAIADQSKKEQAQAAAKAKAARDATKVDRSGARYVDDVIQAHRLARDVDTRAVKEYWRAGYGEFAAKYVQLSHDEKVMIKLDTERLQVVAKTGFLRRTDKVLVELRIQPGLEAFTQGFDAEGFKLVASETAQDLMFTSQHFKLFIITLHVFVTMLSPEEVHEEITEPVYENEPGADVVAALALSASVSVRVLYDYVEGDERLLEIYEGEVLTITDHAQGWLLAVNERGYTGYVPPTYVELCR